MKLLEGTVILKKKLICVVNLFTFFPWNEKYVFQLLILFNYSFLSYISLFSSDIIQYFIQVDPNLKLVNSWSRKK